MRKAWLTLHLTASIGWLGALLAFLGLDIATLTSHSDSTLRAAYITMEPLALWVILPMAVAAFGSGLIMALWTRWGLFRHYWVVASLVLTLLAIVALSVQLPTIADRADVARDPQATTADVDGLGNLVVHSLGGVVVLLCVIAISVFKPRGLTQHGWRKRLQAPGRDDDSG